MENNELQSLINEYKQKMSEIYNIYLSKFEANIKNKAKSNSNISNCQPSISNLNNDNKPTNLNLKQTSKVQPNDTIQNIRKNNLNATNNMHGNLNFTDGNNSIYRPSNAELEIDNDKTLRLPENTIVSNSSSSQVLFNGKTSTANESYVEFLNNNLKSGNLKIQAFVARQAIPINNVEIIISKDFRDGKKIFYTVNTDENGIVDNLSLPAPSKELSMSPSQALPFATYDITAYHPDFQQSGFLNVPIFEGIKSIQYINLLPLQ